MSHLPGILEGTGLLLVGLVFALAAERRTRLVVAGTFLTLPLLRDGPLDADLYTWKLGAVLVLLAVTWRGKSRAAGAPAFAHLALLGIAACVLALIAERMGPSPERVGHFTEVYFTSLAFLFVLARTMDANMLRTLVYCLYLFTIGVCAVALIQYVTIRFRIDHPVSIHLLPSEFRRNYFEFGNTMDARGVRLPSVFFHSNQLGHFLGMSFGFFTALLLGARSSKQAAAYLILIVLCVACVTLSLSRGAVVAMAGEVLIILILGSGAVRRHWRKGLALLAPIGFLALGLRGNLLAFLDRFRSSGLSHRQENWSRAMELIPEHWFFGLGAGRSSGEIIRRFPVFDSGPLFNRFYGTGTYDRWGSAPHNYYLTTLLETGALSLAARLSMYAIVLALGIRLLRKRTTPGRGALALGAFAPLVCEFGRGLFDSYDFLSSMATGALVAFFMALLLYLDATQPRPGSERHVPIPMGDRAPPAAESSLSAGAHRATP